MQTAGYIRNHPLIRITLAYIAGIGVMELLHQFKICIFFTLGIFLTTLFFMILFVGKDRTLRFIYRGMLLYIVFVLAGIFNYYLSNRYNKLPAGKMHYSGIVVSSPVSKDRSTQLDCRIRSIGKDSHKTHLNEKVRIYLEPDTLCPLPKVGDTIFISGQLSEIKNPGNPGEFNYSRYMKHQGIHYSGYFKKIDYSYGKNSGRLRIIRLSTNIQKQLIACFERYNIHNNELAVLSALAAGNRSFLEQELRENYAAVGAMHILAVSGLHVGILYLLLTSLFGNRNQKRYYRLLRTLIILAVIWMYAFITGLSSSVLRAALMFSLFLIGKNLQRQINSYNILAASALLILIINPSELFKVGFQFSYLAVMGIIYFQPKLEKLIFIRNGIIDRIWQLLTVSIAAQLITFPLSLYYFHQFPVYFWLTNIIVIPLVWLIMASAVVFSILIPLTFLLPFIAGILNILLKTLNHAIAMIGELPFSTLTEIRFNTIHLIAFYLFLLFLMIIIIQGYYRYIPHLSCSLIIIILLADIISIRNLSDKKELIIYNVRDNSLVLSLVDGINHTVITKGVESFENDNSIRYIKNYWIAHNINREKVWIPVENEIPEKIINGRNLEIKLMPQGFLIDFYTTQCLYLKNSETANFPASPATKEKILIVDNDSGYPDKDVYLSCAPDLILVSNSLSRFRKNTWKDFADNYGISYYDPQNNGAFKKINLSN